MSRKRNLAVAGLATDAVAKLDTCRHGKPALSARRMSSTNEIRRSFLDYFGGQGHDVVPSAPLVPYNDPTLMFVNAGMVPFKNVFTGLETRAVPRAASSQKCVRAGGKHNDLDNVGYTARHHTFFEMLGNFSFGDYFKEQAIVHAWTLLTKEWGLPADKLTATVYHTDDEAFALWRKIAGLPEERIIRIPTSDNFWSMGDTGPCGPCSEIFYDHGAHIPGGPPGSPDEDGDRFIEIWNLVFMQFEQHADGSRSDLPRPSIDTGMGLERVAAVLQGEHDNYETDTFRALIAASESLTGVAAEGENRASHRVIADHLRSTSFLLADGVLPSNEGRGYVLRRIMRRAMRHAHLLGAKEPLMHRLVPALVTEMGQAYPELGRAQPLIEETLGREEVQFRRTLVERIEAARRGDPGHGRGRRAAGRNRVQALRHLRLSLRPDRGRAARARHRRRPGRLRRGDGAAEGARPRCVEGLGRGRGERSVVRHRRARGRDRVHRLRLDFAARARSSRWSRTARKWRARRPGEDVTVLVNQTPFYGESGGQAGDTGTITGTDGLKLTVSDTAKPLGRLHAHQARVEDGHDRGRRHGPSRSRCRAPRCDPRQPFGDAPAPCRAARPARRACHAEGLAGRGRPPALRLLAPRRADALRTSPRSRRK